MPAAKDPDPLFDALVDELLDEHPDAARGSMFGMACVKVNGKACLGRYQDGANFKLPTGPREAALALPGAGLFDPMGGRPMKEWVLIPDEQHAHWPGLAEAALAYVSRLTS